MIMVLRLASIVLLSATIGLAFSNPLKGQINQHWIGPDFGNWSNPGSWAPFGTPNALTIAQIGSIPGVENGHVNLNVDTSILGLSLTDGMSLHTNGNSVDVATNTIVSGMNGGDFRTRLDISGFGVADDSFDTHGLTINDGARVRMRIDAIMNVDGLLNIQTSNSSLYGTGDIRLHSNANRSLNNDGVIRVTGEDMTITQFGSGLMDLDGLTGNGVVDVANHGFASTPKTLTINGTELADTFSGEIILRGWSTLHTNLNTGWTADSSSEINAFGDFTQEAIRITGSDFTIGGSVNVLPDPVTGTPGELRIESNASLLGTANFSVAEQGKLSFFGEAEIHGSHFHLAEDALLEFEGLTRVHGGTFNTHSSLSSEGVVEFNAATIWHGEVDINGIARQNGSASIGANTIINADVFDMDGNGSTIWNNSRGLTVNASSIDSTISNSFDGTFNFANNPLSSMTINLSDPSAHWTMAGEMNLVNSNAFAPTRVAGSRMRVTGDVNIDGAGVRVSADTDFASISLVNFATEDSSLLMSGKTRVEQGASFVGGGTLINGVGGELTLNDGVSLDDTVLVTRSLLKIDELAGVVGASRFEMTDEATWQIDLGGYVAGDEFDVMLVSGESHIAGTLEVRHLDLGLGAFAPEIGDQFQILFSLDGVMGSFSNDPVSSANGATYYWDVVYNSHDVQLHLASISVPEPNPYLLQFLAGGIFGLRRRGRRTRQAST